MDKSCDGLRVLVTAGAAGIGRATAEAFIEAGARVHVCDIDPAALEDARAALPAAGVTQADAADSADVDRLFAAVDAQLGGLDALINNVGIAGPTKPIEEIEEDEWRQTLEVNLTGQFLATRRAVPLLKAAGGGSIVNLSSVAGRLGFPLRVPYSTTKFGVVGFTEALAVELGPHKIRVNAIMPGMVEGERIERVIAAKAEALDISHEAMRQRLLSWSSMRVAVTPAEIAAMIVYLCAAPGRHISGQSISICGNMEAMH